MSIFDTFFEQPSEEFCSSEAAHLIADEHSAAEPHKNLSTYFPRMSHSIFTESPTLFTPKTVRRLVSGIRETENSLPCNLQTVRLVPSRATEPFITTYLRISAAALTETTTAFPSSLIEVITPVPSICPVTM